MSPSKLLLILVFVVGGGLRLWSLSEPSALIFDETHYVPAARVMAGLAPAPDMSIWVGEPRILKSPDPNFSHPPLGKMLIALGINIAGDNPVGWRLMSALFGIMSLIAFAFLAREFFEDERWAAFATALLAMDFLHIVQSRVAMLDIFVFFFATLTLLALVRILKAGSSSRMLALGAISIGVAAAVKETSALFTFIFVLIFWFGSSEEKNVRTKFCIKFCLLAGATYSLSYFYYLAHAVSPVDWIMLRMRAMQLTAQIAEQHTYASSPGSWIFNARAVWYFFVGQPDSVQAVIAMGHPLIWWAFIPASYMVLAVHRDARRRYQLLPIAWYILYLLALVPLLWSRPGFIYHNLPNVAVVCLGVTQALKGLSERYTRYVASVYMAACVVVLLLALPFILGIPTTQDYYGWFIKFVKP